MSGIRTARGELVIETEEIEVTSNLPRADRNWRFTDAAGHEHYWRDGYPTLVTVTDDSYWCADCRDEHTDQHLECPQCHETVRPRAVGPSGFREFAPGRTTYWLDGVEIDEATARRLYDETRGGAS